eukprot:TRINITY_DN13207_c0_g1_i1.p1 TRINITY_DN13207_c0_g1~~TRINITY_DN13207_c0_g1_i1.p1  ORF type:complete len:795 (-),score=78.29 TRINITY_DN13207_c0_g1_i1:15-2399(-)
MPPAYIGCKCTTLLAVASLSSLISSALAQAVPSLPDFLKGQALQNFTAVAEAPDELFTIIFVADAEPRMRNNTDNEVSQYIANLVSYTTTRVEYFAHAGGTHRIDPKLVILGGDISQDHSTSVLNDWHLWEQLPARGVPVIAGFGNHDWEEPHWYAVSGDAWNMETTDFCRASYRNASGVAAPHFSYKEFGPTDSRGPVTFLAKFRGVQIVNFNSFLYQPSYHYDFTSPEGQKCMLENLSTGFSGCQVFTSAEAQIAELERALDADVSTPTVFVQHYPLTTQDRWWDDQGASKTSMAYKKQRLKDLIGKYSSSALFSGHNHKYAVNAHSSSSGKQFTEYISSYFGGDGGDDIRKGGGFLALLVSPTQGIIEVKHVEAPVFDAAYSYTTTPAAAETTTASASVVDLSILPPDVETVQAQLNGCLTSKCIAPGFACFSDANCTSLATPFATATNPSKQELAEMAWALRHASESSEVVHGLLQCADNNCGTIFLSTPVSSPTLAPIVTTSPVVDLSILPPDVETVQAQLNGCLTSKCIAPGFACFSNANCTSLATPFATATNPSKQELAEMAWALRHASESNEVVHGLLQCADNNCGTIFLSTPVSAPTPAPIVTSSPVPEPAPTPTPAPTPSPVPVLTPSPAPTAAPILDPAPAPMAALTPMAAPSPAPLAAVSPTPAPTPTSAPVTEVPAPTPAPAPIPAPSSPTPVDSVTPSPNPPQTPRTPAQNSSTSVQETKVSTTSTTASKNASEVQETKVSTTSTTASKNASEVADSAGIRWPWTAARSAAVLLATCGLN